MSGTRVEPRRRRRARSVWLKIHLYLGLWAGAVLALLGATGSLLVYDEWIDALLNPQLEVAADSGRQVSPDEVIAAIERRYGRPPLVLFTPGSGRSAYRALMPDSSGKSQAMEEILVDAAAGEILAGRVRGTFFVSIVHTLHTELFLGRAGAYIVAGVSALTILSVASGLYLWWPRGGAFRKALAFHWHRLAVPLNYEIHRTCGFYLATVLFVLAVTGLYLTLPEPFTAAVSSVARVTPWPENVAVDAEHIAPARDASLQGTESFGRAKRLTLAEVDHVVENHTPGAIVTHYSLPGTLREPYEVSFRDPAQTGDTHGRNSLWIHPYSGDILMARDASRLGGGDVFLDLQIQLHNGRVLGSAGEALVFVTGLSMPLMYGTGFYLWWIRRRLRRR